MSGDCFEVAGQLILDDPNLVLVHGLTDFGGSRHWHAWVETVRVVPVPELTEPVTLHLAIDRSNGHNLTVPVGMYYRIGHIVQMWRYTAAEAIAAISVHGTYGPWIPGWGTMGG